MDIRTIPMVFQYNKRDLDEVYTIEELQNDLNSYDAPYYEAVAVTGEGVFPTLKKLSSMVLEHLNKQHGSARIKTRSAVAVKEPAMATAGGGGAAATSAPPSAARPPSPKRAAKSRPERAAARGQSAPRVVRERVSSNPGVKPIERKAPAPQVAASVKRRKQTEPGPTPAPAAGGRGKGKAIAVIVVLVVLAAAGAAVYFSGMWKQFL